MIQEVDSKQLNGCTFAPITNHTKVEKHKYEVKIEKDLETELFNAVMVRSAEESASVGVNNLISGVSEIGKLGTMV